MSRWSNVIIDAKESAQIVSRDMSDFDCFLEHHLKDAVIARFRLDELTLDESCLYDKWAQPMIHNFETDAIAFRGTEQECIEWLNESDNRLSTCEVYWALPGEEYWSWINYFNKVEEKTGKEVCNVKIKF